MMIRKNVFLSKDEDSNFKSNSELITMSSAKRVDIY